jgi:hypothetical protein
MRGDGGGGTPPKSRKLDDVYDPATDAVSLKKTKKV